MKNIYIPTIVTIFIFCTQIHHAFSQNNKAYTFGLGKSLISEKTDTNLILTTEFSKIEIKPVNDDIIRVRVAIDKIFENDYSFSVLPQGSKPKWTLTQNKNELFVQTQKIRLRITKSPVLLQFFTMDNKEVISNDTFGHSYSANEIGCYFKLHPDEKFIGLGEKTGNLNRRGQGYVNWNTDCFGYTNDSDPLYASIPFYIGIHDSLTYGIFLDQTTKSNFNFGASNDRFSSFSVEGKELKYYYISGKNIPEILYNYTGLTGRTPIPPKWSLGYHQSRWSYFPDKEVISLARTFREKDIPLDVVHLDIHYMEDYKIFTWNKNRFPQPESLLSDLEKIGVNTTLILDPGIKVDTNYFAYKSGLRSDVFLKYPDKSLYAGSVWPGLCNFPDFTSTKAREWWANTLASSLPKGVKGFWNDMNEPATWGQKFPSLVKFNLNNNPGTILQARNVYGMLMANASYEGAKKLLVGQRPFVLTRAGFAGVQRYSAIWTGDNTSNEDHLLLGVRLINSLGLSGLAFCGTDVGGFSGEATNSLYAKWITIGAFTPFFRGHKMINMKDSEPWSYGEETEEIARNYIKLRYKLIPYIYSCFYENSKTGMPINRSMCVENPFDDNIYRSEYQNQFMFGPDLLVAPNKSTEAYTQVYLGNDTWYDLYSGDKIKNMKEGVFDSPLYKLPVFVKSSAIIPAQKSVHSISLASIDTLDIHVYFGNEQNSFTFYEDDGISYSNEKGKFYKREISYLAKDNELNISEVVGSFKPSFSKIRFLFHGFENATTFKLKGNKVLHKIEKFSWLDKYYHLYYAKNEEETVKTITLDNLNDSFTISWQ